MKFPDRIFALGGAGKEIAFEVLRADWVLKGILKPRPNPRTLTVTIIDTAEGEQNSDRETIQAIRNRINEHEAELRDATQGRTGTIEIEYKLVTENIQLNGTIDLTGEQAVPRITAGNGMDEDDWWLQDQHINENLDFAKGVIRKRGLSKAIYYKAYAEDDQMSSYVDLPDKGKVAVIAGLGGGTGSGLLIDLARHLQQKQRTAEITLFGILPNHTEGEKESPNAFAALSELEYLSLNDEQVFKDRILLPIDPTNFDGKRGNRIQSEQQLKEFDEAITYLIASYYNTQGLEHPFAGSPKYAPFTIGIPQLLRYNVEAINEARDAFRDILTQKQEALQVEEEIYSEINRFLARQYSADVESGLRDLDRTDLTERVEDIQTLLDFDLFNELEYHSYSVFSDIVNDAQAESEDVLEQIEIMGGSIRAVNPAGQQTGSFVDNIDEHLAEILEKDIELIAQRKDILERKKAISDNRIRDTIEYLIFCGDGNTNPGVKLQRLEAQLEDMEAQRARLQADLEETTSELETLQNAQNEEVTRKVNEWEQDVSSELDQLRALSEQSVSYDLNSLRTALEDFQTAVANAESKDGVEQVQTLEITDLLDQIESDLRQVDIDFQDQRRDIESSLAELKQARKDLLVMYEEESTIEKLTPWTSSTEERQDQAHKDFQMQKSKLDNLGVFKVGHAGANLTVDLVYNDQLILDELADRERSLQTSITNELRIRLDDPRERDLEQVEDEVSRNQDVSAIRGLVREIFEREIEGTAEIQAQKEALEAEFDELVERIEIYEPTIEIFQELNTRRDVYNEHLSSFHTQRSQYETESTQTVSTEADNHVYVKNIKPNDVFRTTGDDDLGESDLFNSREENQRLRQELEQLAKNARSEQYTGLRRRQISKGRSRYNQLKVRVAVLSQAVDQIDPAAIDFDDVFSGAFDLGSGEEQRDPYTSWKDSIGGPWDINLSVFIDGVFLDNLRKVVQANGYRDGYNNREADLGPDIRIHHSLGLDEGFYVRRNEILNMESDSDVGFYLRSEDEIVDDLLTDYIDRIETNSAAVESQSLSDGSVM